jgi:tetratricopeptide (TPR) repeat protein
MTLESVAPGPLFERCARLLRQGDRQASALLPRLEAFLDYAPGWVLLGEALLAANQQQGALIAFGRAATADPGLPAALLGQAAVLLTLGRPEEAARACMKAEPRAPGAKEIPYRLGLCLRAAGRTEAAQAALARAATLDPGFAPAWFSLGLVRQDLHDGPGAIAAYRAALAADPALHEAAFNLGIALQDGGALEAALDAYALALRSRPGSLGRIAHALTSSRTGCLWLSLDALRDALIARRPTPGPELLAVDAGTRQ